MRQQLQLLLVCLLVTLTGLQAQFADAVVYDFTDGTIIAAGQSPAGNLTLSGTYSLHSAQYGLNMKVDGEIDISVPGSCTVRYLGSQYSSLNMQGTATSAGDLGTQNTAVVNDLEDTFDFTLSGPAADLNFLLTAGSGNDLYCPQVEIIPAQPGKDASTAETNIVYYFDLRDGSIIPTDTDGLQDLDVGLFSVLVGSQNAYSYNDPQHGCALKTGNQIILDVAGNSYIRIGGSQFSNGTFSVSSATGEFDVTSQAAATAGNFGNDGSTVDFLYVGTAGEVTIDFTGTNYIPYIEIVPVTYPVSLTPYVQKSGTVSVNEVTITLMSGASADEPAVVSLSEGTVVSATAEEASVLIDLGGEDLNTYTPEFTGDIDTVTVAGDSLLVQWADENSNPTSYLIRATDNSVMAEAEPGVTYTYNFFDGSELPQISYTALRYSVFVSNDGLLTINSNTEEEAGQFGYHDATHGGVFFPGNSFEITVAGNALITFITDTYGVAADAIFEFTDSEGNILGTIPAENLGGADGFPQNFAYEGDAGVVTATLLSDAFPTAEIYLHGLSVANDPETEPTNGKIDVWDFGAEQLDTMLYNNHLNEDLINGWYDPEIAVGSSGNVLPSSWSAGRLSWTGGGNDRLRTTNTNLTRYDENISNSGGLTGRVYVNSGANVGRFMSLVLEEDDEVTLIMLAQNGAGEINFQYAADPEVQLDVLTAPGDASELTFVAKQAGNYRVFDTQDKPSYYRISRKEATYVTITGLVDTTQAPGIPSGFEIVYTNEAGKSWSAPMANDAYEITVPAGYNYELSLTGANGYIISSATTIEVTEETTTFDVTIEQVLLFTVSGAVNGLGTDIANLNLIYTPDAGAGAIFAPTATVDTENATYSVQLEPNIEYTISAEGVNDYNIPTNTITIAAEDTNADIDFVLKPLHSVAITTEGLTTEQQDALHLVFHNLNEEGYSYTFSDLSGVALRDGTYSISMDGMDDYPVQMRLTSNLTIAGADASKTLTFDPVTYWPFDDRVISNGDPAYKGLLFSGSVSNEILKSHLVVGTDGMVQVPVNPGETVIIEYYYTADFTIDGGDPVTTNTQSTSIIERVLYTYSGDVSGYATIAAGGSVTTYITDIWTYESFPYTSPITVGEDKDFLTINGALDAVRRMTREADQPVLILIDPGNYEEMLVIDEPNITLKNAAVMPDIEMMNEGVDISANAVRVTSYYGHGYHYYSMGPDNKWNEQWLAVNTANGYHANDNAGAGTTNGSYWNATVVVTADDFTAEHIIFENSFNQYISQKESEDILVMWDSGSPGVRPTDVGNTSVQDRGLVERAAAIAITNGTDRVVLKKCRVIGRQDSFFGGHDCRVVMYKGSAMGAVDYIFGGMTAVFYQTELAMNTSDVGSDRAYITAAQQGGGRGYLMYECTVTSADPGTESASLSRSKPGYFGRPWQATTSEVVFYNTTIETSDYPGAEGQSLILPLGWDSSLGGESPGMYEYGTTELSGEDNSGSRAGWATLLDMPMLPDGEEITTFNFTKGDDGWDPLPALIEEDVVAVRTPIAETAVQVHSFDERVYITEVEEQTFIRVYGVDGVLYRSLQTASDTSFVLPGGFWIIAIDAPDGRKAVKVITH